MTILAMNLKSLVQNQVQPHRFKIKEEERE